MSIISSPSADAARVASALLCGNICALVDDMQVVSDSRRIFGLPLSEHVHSLLIRPAFCLSSETSTRRMCHSDLPFCLAHKYDMRRDGPVCKRSLSPGSCSIFVGHNFALPRHHAPPAYALLSFGYRLFTTLLKIWAGLSNTA